MKALNFPTRLTSEEQALLDKYVSVKKKKKEVASSQSQEKPFDIQSLANHPTKSALQLKSSDRKHTRDNHKQGINAVDAMYDAKDAKEKAKQLIAAGQVTISKSDEQRPFKRARPVTEKRSKDKNSRITISQVVNDTDKKKEHAIKPPDSPEKRRVKKSPEQYQQRAPREDHRSGQSTVIFVSGFGLTLEILDDCFTRFGSVTNTQLDKQKGHGFVTFTTLEAAGKAVAEMHGELVRGVTLKVKFARQRYDPKLRWNRNDNAAKSSPLENHDASLKPSPREQKNDPIVVPRERSAVPRLVNVQADAKKVESKKTELLAYSNEDEFDF